MFRRPKKEITIEEPKPIEKCSFCKKNDSVGNIGIVHYCSRNSCATKLWDNKAKQDAVEFERDRKKDRKESYHVKQ